MWVQGKRFGTIGASRNGRTFEITTHRAEVYVPDSRKPEVVFGDDVVTDLSRRDFTVNAMALRLPDLELIDPFDGLSDLSRRRLRTPLDPVVSFSDDPLRMLRAARFISGYQLEPSSELVAAVANLHERLSIVSAERIRDELDRLLTLPDPQPGLWFRRPHGVGKASFCPSFPRWSLSKTRSIDTKTSWHTPSLSWRRRGRTASCDSLRCSTTWANLTCRVRSRAKGSAFTTMTSLARV